jgi:hypothetical protein
MHFLYADESGSVADITQQYFVLAGISVFERQVYWASQRLDAIAARFNPGQPMAIELHGSPMLNGSGMWRSFPLPNRIAAMKDALSAINAHPSNRVFGAAIKKVRAATIPRDPVELAFEQLSSRFDQYLMRLHRKQDTQRGVIIFDKSNQESSIQKLASDYRRVGHTWGKLRNLAEVPLFLDSQISRLVQLADLIAYALFRNFERNDPQFYNIVSPHFDSEGGVVHGLYHYS